MSLGRRIFRFLSSKIESIHELDFTVNDTSEILTLTPFANIDGRIRRRAFRSNKPNYRLIKNINLFLVKDRTEGKHHHNDKIEINFNTSTPSVTVKACDNTKFDIHKNDKRSFGNSGSPALSQIYQFLIIGYLKFIDSKCWSLLSGNYPLFKTFQVNKSLVTEFESYYSKYLKYKAKYLDLRKLQCDSNFREVFTMRHALKKVSKKEMFDKAVPYTGILKGTKGGTRMFQVNSNGEKLLIKPTGSMPSIYYQEINDLKIDINGNNNYFFPMYLEHHTSTPDNYIKMQKLDIDLNNYLSYELKSIINKKLFDDLNTPVQKELIEYYRLVEKIFSFEYKSNLFEFTTRPSLSIINYFIDILKKINSINHIEFYSYLQEFLRRYQDAYLNDLEIINDQLFLLNYYSLKNKFYYGDDHFDNYAISWCKNNERFGIKFPKFTNDEFGIIYIIDPESGLFTGLNISQIESHMKNVLVKYFSYHERPRSTYSGSVSPKLKTPLDKKTGFIFSDFNKEFDSLSSDLQSFFNLEIDVYKFNKTDNYPSILSRQLKMDYILDDFKKIYKT